MKSILITGASSGIGRCTAEHFLRGGWRVGRVARRGELLEQIAGEFDGAVVLSGDVTDADAMKSAFAAFINQAGHLDVVFNNAGVFGPSGSIDEINLDDWETVLDVNLRGMFITARLAFAQMRTQEPQVGGGSSTMALCQPMSRAPVRCVTRQPNTRLPG